VARLMCMAGTCCDCELSKGILMLLRPDVWRASSVAVNATRTARGPDHAGGRRAVLHRRPGVPAGQRDSQADAAARALPRR
jgi:hypothetical protein